MIKLPTLQPGDTVEIVAPASRCLDTQLSGLKQLLESWQLTCLVPQDIFGADAFSANTDEARFKHLHHAVANPVSKAVICARGGYGSMRLIPDLLKLPTPAKPKILVGMSDITALHLFFLQHWQWPTLHGALGGDRFSPESTSHLKALLFGEMQQIDFKNLKPLNTLAEKVVSVKGSITGGNLALVQASAGTPWQMQAKGKIVLLEDVNERGYKIDRMLEHIRQAGMLEGAVAILLGDFLEGKEPDGSSLVDTALFRFAASCPIPVVQVQGIGHGYVNLPIPLGTEATLQLGENIQLTCLR